MLSKALRCSVGIHNWTTIDGVRDRFPENTPVECRRCDAQLDRLPSLWIGRNGAHARCGSYILGWRWIVVGVLIVFTFLYPLLWSWMMLLLKWV